MAQTTITVTTEIDLDIETAAKWFANLADDQMAQFLVGVAAEAANYPRSPDNQWYYLGKRLREEGAQEAREMVQQWADFIKPPDGGTM